MMYNLYDAERKMLKAHDDLNKVSRNYRPELLDGFDGQVKSVPARLLNGLGVIFLKLGQRLTEQYEIMPPVETTADA